MQQDAIGVIDSGMGGVSVMASLVKCLPEEYFIYWGDNLNAPYGTRPEAEIRRLTRDMVERLLARGVKAIVIACNTATSAAARTLRAELNIPVLGMEPALKPASIYAQGRRIAVLATAATLRQPKYRVLCEKYGQHAVNIACPELVEFTERGETDSDEVRAYIAEKLAQCPDACALVLGCTHFVLLKDTFAAVVPGCRIFDGNEGVARYLKQRLTSLGLVAHGAGGWELNTTAPDAGVMALMRGYMARALADTGGADAAAR